MHRQNRSEKNIIVVASKIIVQPKFIWKIIVRSRHINRVY
jgi:hypothetical protein